MVRYDLIMESGEYALILRGNKMKEYAVVNGLNKETGEWVGLVVTIAFIVKEYKHHVHKQKRWHYVLIIYG